MSTTDDRQPTDVPHFNAPVTGASFGNHFEKRQLPLKILCCFSHNVHQHG